MSGGVDSSVAALLMKKQRYEVIAAFMKNWSDTKDPITGECSWKKERRMAMKIAAKLNIPFKTLDFEKEYKRDVIEDMFKKYKKGITPNPDVDCNKKIKFPLLIKAAKKLGCSHIVTGHYARIKENKGKYQLLRGKDESKDQSYFLYRLTQNDLKHTLFPIGELTKKEVREIAKKNKFPNYNKKGTVGICFIGKINLKQFLQKKIKPREGKILNPEGKQIGTHDGIYYYTIGQRIGPKFGINIKKGNETKPKKWYVAIKDLKKNIIVAAPEGHKINFRKDLIVKDFYLIDQDEKDFIGGKTKVHSRIRHVGELIPSELRQGRNCKRWKITLKEPITGISEGQAIVLYQKDKCIGGGVISFQ